MKKYDHIIIIKIAVYGQVNSQLQLVVVRIGTKV